METENKESMMPRISPILAIASFVILSIFLVASQVLDAYWIIILFFVGCITGIIANNKGRDFWGWWFFGILFFILALPLVLVLKPDEKGLVEKGIKKKCPQCAELVKTEAVKCRYCGSDLRI